MEQSEGEGPRLSVANLEPPTSNLQFPSPFGDIHAAAPQIRPPNRLISLALTLGTARATPLPR